jgi:hypothetical protein
MAEVGGVEGDLNSCEMDMSFLSQYEKKEIVPGITKYCYKVPQEAAVVEEDSHVHVYRQHRTKEGEYLKPNNPNERQGLKIKLGGEGHKELVMCLKTMRPDEVSYYLVDRATLDKDEPKLDPELMTAEEKKKDASNKMMDGYHRLHLATETKIQKNAKGVSETPEMRLNTLAEIKKLANQHFKDNEFKKAVKEYAKGLKLSINVPKLKPENPERQAQIMSEITVLKKQMINNALKTGYKMKMYDDCKPFFEKEVVAEMKDDLTYINSIAQIWGDECTRPDTEFDVEHLIELIEDFLSSHEDLPEADVVFIKNNLQKIKKYERKYNILNNLSSYSAKAEEFERENKIKAKIQEMLEQDFEDAEDLDVEVGVEKAEDHQNT